MNALYLLALLGNAWVLLAILAGAFMAQFAMGEPPCPLCVMQRVATKLRRNQVEQRRVVACSVEEWQDGIPCC